METLKKITIKDVIGKPEIGKKVLIGGVAEKHQIKMTNFGESIYFTGNFVAVDPTSKKQFESNTIYLPGDVSESMARTMDKQEENDETPSVEFQLEVSVVASEKSNTGYSYMTREIETKESVNVKKKMADSLIQSCNLLESPGK